MYNEITAFIRSVYQTDNFIPLHEPRFVGNEKKYLMECIDSTFVSSVGAFVDRFERDFAQYVGAKYAVAAMNGTAALHISLLLSGVESGDEVITQPLTFIATANAISYIGADPVFVDVDVDTMGLSPSALEHWLTESCVVTDGVCLNKTSGRVVRACVPMHTFGHPCRIDEIQKVCEQWCIALVEDAAESLGSYYKGKHTGTYGRIGAFSFNGNKIITSGGGGVIVTDDELIAKRAKHITTTAKVPHRWEYAHDEVGFNYRLPNLNAALLCAQLEQLDAFVANKRDLAGRYQQFFAGLMGVDFVSEPDNCVSNYWLNAVMLPDLEQRDHFLQMSNDQGVMTRPIWKLMNHLPMFQAAQKASLPNAEYLEARIVNIPSSVRI